MVLRLPKQGIMLHVHNDLYDDFKSTALQGQRSRSLAGSLSLSLPFGEVY